MKCLLNFNLVLVLACILNRLPGQYNYISQFGTPGSGNGQFQLPYDVATDGSGNVYVTDEFANRVQKFDAAGNYLMDIGSPSLFSFPHGIALDGQGNIYVVSSGHHKIKKFSPAGTYLAEFGSQGTGNGQFNIPYGIAINAAGDIFVTDETNDRIQVFDAGGTYVNQFGTYGFGNGQFYHPHGICLDPSGNIYVSEWGGQRVQKFNSSFVHQATFANNITPGEITYDSNGRILVTDNNNNRVLVYSTSGTLITQFGSTGAGNGQFVMPFGVHYFNGNVWVVSQARVQKFGNCFVNATVTDTTCFSYLSPDGNFTWTSSGTYLDTLITTLGCDSFITVNLTINTPDTSVTVNGNTLTSNAAGASWQWMDCATGFNVIAGANAQSFVPTVSGTYAVAVVQDGCADTSGCFQVTLPNETDEGVFPGFLIYPNPARGPVRILFSQPAEGILYLTDLSGNQVMELDPAGTGFTLDLSSVPAGVYLLSFNNGTRIWVSKLIHCPFE